MLGFSTESADHSFGIRAKTSLALAALALGWLSGSVGRAQVLLDDTWADGSRAESNRPSEAAVWVGRTDDVSVSSGVLSTKMGDASQKIWFYFTDSEPVTLQNGQELTASITFVPRGALYATTSRNFRFGVFYDPTSPRVETDTNSDSGGEGAPWADAEGYAVQMLVTNDSYATSFDLGKRVNLKDQSLLGTSGDYLKISGGPPAHSEVDADYTATLEVKKVSDTQVDLTASLRQGDNQLSTWSVSDNGAMLGSAPVYDKFDLLFIRISNNTTSADQIDFKGFKVEVTDSGP